jgi:hypothetical protein
MSWTRKTDPEKVLEAQLLRRWRLRRLETQLTNLPLHLMLLHQFHRMEAIEEDALAKTGSLPVRRQLKRLIRIATVSASRLIVKRPLKWLCRRRCLQPLRFRLVRGRRRLLVWLLTFLARKLRQSLGSPKR